MVVYAHTLSGRPMDEWQELERHLAQVSRLAGDFAAVFGSRDWGEIAGLWHDLGKYAADFQAYLIKSFHDLDVVDASILDSLDSYSGRVDHSSAGAIHAYRKAPPGKRVALRAEVEALAMVIAGHHGGLAERSSFEAKRLKNQDKAEHHEAALAGSPPPEILDLDLPKCPDFLIGPAINKDLKPLRFEFWTRMLFSALIDADRLDSENFENARKSLVRARLRGGEALLDGLLARLDARIEQIASGCRKEVDSMAGAGRAVAERVLDLRARVLEDCRRAASRPAGRHSLTVPTGGAKTLSAMAFALGHARANQLRRVIVVIPFTSIIDQTTETYRKAFRGLSRSAIIEHHSNLDPLKETARNRLASENWDAPVVVTTSVQFFESLFSDKPSRCRKLHNIAKSVIVFDEVQSLPHELRSPIFDGLNQLVDHYGCSLLLCTATQPALELDRVGRQGFPCLNPVVEVTRDVSGAFAAVANRVEVEFRDCRTPLPWEELAKEVRELRQALVIVHRRSDARELYRLLPDNLSDNTFHLSALMCSAHRRETLDRIRSLLKANEPCRVVSTTLIEAGVDVDFPVVFRAYGGIDALAQAAGRCNREGKLPGVDGLPAPGRLVLFLSPSDPPPGLTQGLDITRLLLERHGGRVDLFAHETYQEYFREFLAATDPDVPKVNVARVEGDFPEVAKRFRMIDDGWQVGVVAPFGDAAARIEDYRSRPRRRTLRALQPYLVNIPIHALGTLDACIELVNDQVSWIYSKAQYDQRLGLIVDEALPMRPEDLNY